MKKNNEIKKLIEENNLLLENVNQKELFISSI